MTVGLGIVTCRRPEYLRQVLTAVEDQLSNVVDEILVHHDGDVDPAHEIEGLSLEVWLDHFDIDGKLDWGNSRGKPRGVGRSKNVLLRDLVARHDWIFISEDDVVPVSPKAITGYVEACERSGLHHLSFHAHGPMNASGGQHDGPVTYWAHSVGAWCIYSRECLLKCGLMDETFVNAWEHVEHTLRLGVAGYTSIGVPGAGKYADATGSEKWLKEIPGSIENSSIPAGAGRHAHQHAGRLHWKQAHPETYGLVFPE